MTGGGEGLESGAPAGDAPGAQPDPPPTGEQPKPTAHSLAAAGGGGAVSGPNRRGEPPRRQLAVCDAPRCRPLLGVEADDLADADAWLHGLVRVLRERGVVGRLIVQDADTGRAVAPRPTWP